MNDGGGTSAVRAQGARPFPVGGGWRGCIGETSTLVSSSNDGPPSLCNRTRSKRKSGLGPGPSVGNPGPRYGLEPFGESAIKVLWAQMLLVQGRERNGFAHASLAQKLRHPGSISAQLANRQRRHGCGWPEGRARAHDAQQKRGGGLRSCTKVAT